MDTLSRGHSTSPVNGFQQFEQHSRSEGNLVNGSQFDRLFTGVPGLSNLSSSQFNGTLSNEGNSPVEGDYFDGVFKYLQQMLMEEDDLADKPCMFQDCLALHAAEKSFYEALNQNPPPPPPSPTRSSSATTFLGVQIFNSPIDDFAEVCPAMNHDHVAPLKTSQPNNIQPGTSANSFDLNVDYLVDPCLSPSQGTQSSNFLSRSKPVGPCEENPGNVSGQKSTNESREKTNRRREEYDDSGRSNKQFASYSEQNDNTEDYDNALLCPARDPNFYGESPGRSGAETSGKKEAKRPQYVPPTAAKRGRPRTGSKRENIREVVDLRDALTRCARAAAIFDNWGANELLQQIRQHSSPYGDPTERLAHCFANALEARIAGMGSALYTTLTTKRASAADILRAYQAYLGICPFQRMSNIFANKSIAKITVTATRVHIIDFGILYGFQWPCLLHGISLRPGGPPKLRITGIDLPQPGFRPAERIEETGRRLANYAKRFNVPFEFNAVAKRWDTINEEDLMIDKDEMLVVNCLYRLRNVPDETLMQQSCLRDSVLKLIWKLNPVLFVHGILNGTYNAPFFETRFKEALYHFSSFFDLFEANLPREDPDRMMFEKEVMGRDVMNVVACEGTERVERPETYKQWYVRDQRAGFKPLALNPEIMREVKFKTKSYYHKEFLVDEHNNWMLQGWKESRPPNLFFGRHNSIDLMDKITEKGYIGNRGLHERLASKVEISAESRLERERRRSVTYQHPRTRHAISKRARKPTKERRQGKRHILSEISGKTVSRKRRSIKDSTMFTGPKTLAQLKEEKKKMLGSMDFPDGTGPSSSRA